MDEQGSRPAAALIEGLWVRLKTAGRIRLRDAHKLRRLGVRPFDTSSVYETDALGYVISVGTPGNVQRIDADKVMSAFEAHFGVPATYLDHIAEAAARDRPPGSRTASEV